MDILRVLLLLAACTEHRSQILPVEEACKYLPCYRSSPRVSGGKCFCAGFYQCEGKRCEKGKGRSDWPVGLYALPMSVYGCPESQNWFKVERGWSTGYLNMTFKENITQYAMDSNKSITDISKITLLGPYDDYNIQMNFCYKSNDRFIPSRKSTSWPNERYKIYRAGGTCPPGFYDSLFRTELPPLLHHNIDGAIPDIQLWAQNQSTVLQIHTCDKDSFGKSIPFNKNAAFILLKNASEHEENRCPVFPGLTPHAEELVVMSLKYCSYMPTWADTKMAKPVTMKSGPMGLLYFMMGKGPGIAVNNALNEFRLSIGNYSLPASMNGAYISKGEALWILLDLTYNRFVFFVYIKSPYVTFTGPRLLHRDFPVMSCNSKKWSFLHNGGVRSLDLSWSINRYDDYMYIAAGNMLTWYCRYMAIFADRSLMMDEDLYTLFSRIEDVRVRWTTDRESGADLGMKDGRIDDFQISASSYAHGWPPKSARPDLQGWCPANSDLEPFLQIDLIAASGISGIRIYNWFKTVSFSINNTFISERRRQGMDSFHVKYGFSQQDLVDYIKGDGTDKFFIDTSQPYSDEQTFLFPSIVFASLIQIHPRIQSQETPCMKIDLIGLQPDVKSLVCGEDEGKFWVATEVAFASLKAPFSSPMSNVSSCKDACRASKTCVAVMFNHRTETCSQFTSPTVHDWVKRKKEANSTLLQLMCFGGREIYEVKRGKIKVVVAQGYPTVSDVLTTESRPIDLYDTGSLLHLIFTNLTMDEYEFQKQSIEDANSNCKDEIRIVDESFDTIYEIPLPVGGQLVLPHRTDFASISVERCSKENQAHAVKYRMIAIPTPNLWCKSVSSPHGALYYEECAVTEGTIASNSFLGLTYRSMQNEYWNIKGSNWAVELDITEMFVSCSSGSVLEVIYASGPVGRFCNGQRPIGKILSINTQLMVYFHSRPQTSLTEGFIAEYRERQYRSDTSNADCRGDKCYHFLNVPTSKNLTASEAEKYCRRYRQSSTLVQISDVAEATFIKSTMIKRVINVRDIGPKISTMGYVYIGLRRYLKGGRVEEEWTSRRPVSYTEWRTGHPGDGISNGGCTRMGLTAYADANSWEAIPCDKHEAEYFICESENPTKQDDNNLHSLLVVPTNETTDLKYRHFRCGSGEMIAFLFRCDDLKDCLDGTDEDNCIDSSGDVRCPEGYFQCQDGGCVPVSACCDYVSDCEDESDEYCDLPPCNSTTEYTCHNKQCIDRKSKCDGVPNCFDGSDEDDCDTCPQGMFECWDKQLFCFPSEKICDGFIDCFDERDERDCKHTCLGSCREWWAAGHRKSGEYCIDGNRVECNFDKKGIVQTIYYDMEGRAVFVNGEDSIDVVYESLGFVQWLANNLSCIQSIKSDCRPPTTIVANAEKQLEQSTFDWHCFCVRWTTGGGSIGTPEPCSDETKREVALRGQEWLQKIAMNIERHEGFPIKNIRFDSPSQPLETLTFEHIICEEDFNYTDPGIVCKRGNIVSHNNECLYQVDHRGYIKGCADLTHLQNCENFVCPDGFVKCPQSYCIPYRFLCDGKIQCPKGNDEINCWCGNMSTEVTMIFPDGDEQLYDTVFTMATHLHQSRQNGSNIRWLKYSARSDNGTKEELTSSKHDSADIRYFDDRMYEQMNDAYFSSNIVEMFQHALEKTYTPYGENDVTLIFLNNEELSTGEFSKLLVVNKTLANLYVVIVGNATLGDADRNNFPKGTSFIYAKDGNYPATFAMEQFSLICPAPITPVCDGLYRCHSSRMCLEPSLVCDGIPQCPQRDDERLCSFICPQQCACVGFSVNCSFNRATKDTLSGLSNITRSLNLNNNNISDVSSSDQLPYMVTLLMSFCRLSRIPRTFIKGMDNLRFLDLSFNAINIIKEGDLGNKPKLVQLNLEGNNLLQTIETRTFEKLISIRTLIIRETNVDTIEPWTFSEMNLDLLDLSKNKLSKIELHAFGNLRAKALNISNNKIVNFPGNMLKDIKDLQYVVTDAYRFCCIKPKYLSEKNCKPGRDEFSSCEDLMRNEPLRFLLWLVGFLSLVGNILSLIYRVKYDRKKLKLGYGVFVTNLAVSDFLMGMYLFIIATADVMFRGRYILNDEWWRNSYWCKMAGILATLSSEASVLFICLITLDRFLVIKYPFGDLRFKTKSAVAVCLAVWIVVAVIACLPLVWTSYFQINFYSQSGVCLALPLTRKHTEGAGSAYSIAIFIGLNFIVFLLISIGQALIFWEMIKSSKSSRDGGQTRQRDLKVARNLFLVVMTDFLCWFPICVVGFLALAGVTISGSVYSWAAVVILPINSALNPFLYTFSTILGKKKVEPEMKEQVRPKEIKLSRARTLLKVWNDTFILQKPCGHKLVSLPHYASKYDMTARDVLKIAHEMINVINQLHDNALVTNGLSKFDVRVSVSHKKVSRVLMKISPRFMIKKKEKKEDVKFFAEILEWLLHKIDEKKHGMQSVNN